MAATAYPYDLVILTTKRSQGIGGIGRYQTGAGYRFLELALTLRDHGLRVAIVAPRPTDFEDPPIDILDRRTLPDAAIGRLAAAFTYCLAEEIELVEALREDGKTLIYDSFITPLEQWMCNSTLALDDPADIDAFCRDSVARQVTLNGLADYFLVGMPEEKLLKIGELLAAGQLGFDDNLTLAQRLPVLPVCGFSNRSLPAGDVTPRGNTFLWNGGLWNHYGGFDDIIDGVWALRAEGLDVSFRFMYRNDAFEAYARILERIRVQRLEDFVRLPLAGEPVPDFFSKPDIIRACRGVVVLNPPTILSQVFMSMRLREVMLFQKPVIVSGDCVQADFVRRHGIGLVVGGELDLREAMRLLATDDALYRRLVGNIVAMRGEYCFERYAGPIVDVVRQAGIGGRRATHLSHLGAPDLAV